MTELLYALAGLIVGVAGMTAFYLYRRGQFIEMTDIAQKAISDAEEFADSIWDDLNEMYEKYILEREHAKTLEVAFDEATTPAPRKSIAK